MGGLQVPNGHPMTRTLDISSDPNHSHWQGRVGVGGRAARSLQNAAMHLRKVCAHPYLFLDRLQPPYAPADAAELVRASGKLALLDDALPKLRATGHRVLLFSQMTRALDVVEDFLDLRGLPCLRLDGACKN